MPKIGNVKIKNNLVLAPMVNITDIAFRNICKEFGAGLVYTEMINANAVVRKNKATLKKLQFTQYEKPITVQLFGANQELLVKAAKIVENKKPDIIDLNLGCPDKQVLQQGAGAALLKRPKKIATIIKALVKNIKVPITAKIRLTKNTLKIAKIIEKSGASALAIHARTPKQGYSGKANWEEIKKIKSSLQIPIIASGDVFSKQDATKIKKTTNCDFIMIARGAMTNPYIFREILHNKKTRPIEKLNLFYKYTKLAKKYKILKFAAVKRHTLNFTKGIYASTKLRREISKSKNINEIKTIIEKFKSNYLT